MFISDQSVRRPVFATVVSALLVILGLASLNGLPVRQYPDVDSPVVSIETSYRGASAEVVETKVTQVIEDVIAGIEGIVKLTSGSRDERSDIRVEFTVDRDIDAYWAVVDLTSLSKVRDCSMMISPAPGARFVPLSGS